MKRKVCVIFLMCFFCRSIYGEIYTGKCGENAMWSFDFDEEVLTISGVGEMYDYESSDDTPWKSYSWKIGKIVVEDGITSIGSYAFNVMSHCTSVTLGESIVSIHDNAFYYSKYFKQLTIPDKVKTIGSEAFSMCEGIQRLYIGESVDSVGSGAFSSLSALEEVHIKSVESWLKIKFCFQSLNSNPTTISSNPCDRPVYLFINNQRIRTLVIPEGVEELRKYSFCNALIDTLFLPSSLKNMDVYAFANRDSLKYITVHSDNRFYDSREDCNAVIETATNTLMFGCNKTKIPNTIVAIDDRAFYGCAQLYSIQIPESVKSIGKSAFRSCTALEIVTIPNSVKMIEDYTFYGCRKLNKVVFGTSVEEIQQYAFNYCTSLDSLICLAVKAPVISKPNNTFEGVKVEGIIACPEESDYTEWMKSSLYSSGWRLSNMKKPLSNEIWYTSTNGSVISPNVSDWFFYNNNISKIYPSIVNNAYHDNLGIVRFDMPVQQIPKECYKDNNTLVSIILPDDVEVISNEAFYNCQMLDSIYIPAKVSVISEKAFGVNVHLRKIVVSENNKTYDSRENCNAIISSTTNTLILGACKTVIPLSVTSIGPKAFEYNIIESIEIPNSVVSIRSRAFSSCSRLKYLEIPTSVITIDTDAFWNCNSLTYIDLPSSIEKIGDLAFSGCSNLVYLDLPKNLKTIPRISNCQALKHITIGNHIVSVKNGDILNCNSLKSITVKTIVEPNILSDYSYSYFCVPNNTGVLYHPKDSEYKKWMSQLSVFNWTEDTIPVRKDNEVWYRTTDGEPLVFSGEDLFGKPIVNNGFKAGYGIVEFDTPITKINQDAFKGNDLLLSMTIPSTVETIGDGAFADCSNLRIMTVDWETPPVISDDVFEGALCETLYVPQNTRRLYEKTPGWNKFQKIIQPYNYVEEVKIEVSDYTVREGETLNVKATVFPDDAVIKDLDWLSSDETVASVKDGMIIGKKVGTAEIIAKAVDGSLIADTILIEVTPVLAEKILLNQDNIHILREHSVLLKAQLFPEKTTYKEVIWESSDENILKVEAGVITGKKAGVAYVTVKTTDGSALMTSCRVEVENYFPADVNWDADFNIADVAGTVNFLMEKNVEGLIFDAADMNKDGLVLVNDLKDVLDVILNVELNDNYTSYVRNAPPRVERQPEITISDCQNISGTDVKLRLGLTGGQMFSAIQFDLVLPEGITLTGIKEGIDLTSHCISSKNMGNRVVRITIYSKDNSVFADKMEDFIVMDICLGKEECENILLHQIIVATPMAKAIKLTDATISINNDETTNFAGNPISGNEKGDKNIVNLIGVSVDDHYKGIVIKGGKKIIMK